MKTTFRVIEVFRLAQRKGPILVGKLLSGNITVGDRLAIQNELTTVIAIDMPTESTMASQTLSVVVSPDLGSSLRPGAELDVLEEGNDGDHI